MANTNKDTPQGGRRPYIDSSTAMGAYEESKLWLRKFHEPIDEFERIARNRPKDNIPDGLPKLTEGTTSAIVQENPRRVIQQLASGKVKYSSNPAFAAIADVVHRRILRPSYEMNGTALQKSWNMQTKALIWGMSTSYTFFTFTNGKFHTDYSIPYIKDVGIEKGKVYSRDSNVRWMRSWYSKSDIKRIINRERAMAQNQKGYKSDWDLVALADLLDTSGSTKSAEFQTPAEREKGSDSSGGYEMIHIFQEGKSAEFYSFSPRYKEGRVLRTKINSDPRGMMPLDDEYCAIDLSNPIGRGMVELAAPLQNLMDQKLQQNSYGSTLALAGPLQVWGNVNKASLKFGTNRIWDMGTNPNNKVEQWKIDNYFFQSFVGDMQFLQSKIQALFASSDNSIPASEGNVGQSKTSAGVKSNDARVGVSDNYFLKQHEAWDEAESETSINQFFSEMKGTGELQLEGDDLHDMLDGPAAEFVDRQTGILTIPYDDISKIAFTFEVDPSSSEVKEDADNAQKLTEVLKIMQASQDPNIIQKVPQVIKLIIDDIGAEGTDDLFPELKKDENGQLPQQEQQDPNQVLQQVMPQVQQMVQQMFQEQAKQPKLLGESVAWKPGDLTDSERAQALQQVGIQADQSGAPTPNELQTAHDQSMEIHDKSHSQAMDMHKQAQQEADGERQALESAQQFQQQQAASKESELLQLKAKQSQGAGK